MMISGRVAKGGASDTMASWFKPYVWLVGRGGLVQRKLVRLQEPATKPDWRFVDPDTPGGYQTREEEEAKRAWIPDTHCEASAKLECGVGIPETSLLVI